MEDTETPARLTVAEIALLREIAKWRRNHDVTYWRARHPIGRFVQWKATDRREVVWEPGERPMGHTGPGIGLYEWVRVETVTQAVDVLVALGYLPARFSSAYRAGWHAAQVWHNVWINDEWQQDAEFARLFKDETNIAFPVMPS